MGGHGHALSAKETYLEHTAKRHPFHVLPHSPWPLLAAGGACQVMDVAALAARVSDMLTFPERAAAMARAASDVVSAASDLPGRMAGALLALRSLADANKDEGPRAKGPTRVYFGPELDKLDLECRGFLLFLEQHGILDADQRELVLDRAMALDQDELDLEDLKWVVLLVLFNQPGSEAAYAWMETQMFLDEPEPVH